MQPKAVLTIETCRLPAKAHASFVKPHKSDWAMVAFLYLGFQCRCVTWFLLPLGKLLAVVGANDKTHAKIRLPFGAFPAHPSKVANGCLGILNLVISICPVSVAGAPSLWDGSTACSGRQRISCRESSQSFSLRGEDSLLRLQDRKLARFCLVPGLNAKTEPSSAKPLVKNLEPTERM